MATIHTLIDYDRQNPTAISREAYEDVGADAFSPGTFPRAFIDLEVWDAASGGNQLVLDTDYELVDVDLELSGANYEDETVYVTLRIINVGYQAGFIYLTYGAVGTYPTAPLHDASGLPAAGALAGTEPFATVQSGQMVKATADQIAVFATTPVFKAISADYTITDEDAEIFSLTAGAIDRTITLPLLANGSPGDEKELVKADSGAGKGTLQPHATDANSIDGAAFIDIDSQYNRVRVRHMGTWWKVIAYEDHGSNANGEWRRNADGSGRYTRAVVHSGIAINNASGNIFVSSPQAAPSFPVTAVSVKAVTMRAEGTNAVEWVLTSGLLPTTSAWGNYRLADSLSTATANLTVYCTADIRWRT